MTAYERSGWRDGELSLRHRLWGDDVPAVDVDFLLIEYDRGAPVAVIDYKHHKKKRSDIRLRGDSNHQALGSLHNSNGAQIPFYICRYWPGTWAVEAIAVNEAAIRRAPALRDWFEMTESQWVTGLYRLRNRIIPEGIDVLLNQEMPPVEKPDGMLAVEEAAWETAYGTTGAF